MEGEGADMIEGTEAVAVEWADDDVLAAGWAGPITCDSVMGITDKFK